jgi:pyridoxamine 5'-phosphate oxidase-like protein
LTLLDFRPPFARVVLEDQLAVRLLQLAEAAIQTLQPAIFGRIGGARDRLRHTVLGQRRGRGPAEVFEENEFRRDEAVAGGRTVRDAFVCKTPGDPIEHLVDQIVGRANAFPREVGGEAATHLEVAGAAGIASFVQPGEQRAKRRRSGFGALVEQWRSDAEPPFEASYTARFGALRYAGPMPKSRPTARPPKATRPQMPGYGLPKGTKGLLPWRWAEQRLSRSHNYVLMTVHPDATPHAMIVWGIWVDGRFYFSTGRQSRKARNLASNPACVVCTEEIAAAAIVEGTAAEVTDAGLLARLAAPYFRKYKPWKLDPEMGPIFEVRPRVAFGLRERTFKAATRWRFDAP